MNRKNLAKRLLSFALALCMIAAIVPQMPQMAAAGETQRSLVYDFRKAYPVDLTTITYDMTTSDSDNSDTELNTSIFSDPWIVSAAINGMEDYQSGYLSNKYNCLNGHNLGIRVSPRAGEPTISFQIPEGQGGTYMPAITIAGNWGTSYAAEKTGANLKVVLKNSSGTVVASVENVNARGIHGPMTINLSDKPIEFAAGTYTLLLTWMEGPRTAYPGESGYITYLTNLKLLNDADYNAKLTIDTAATPKKYVYDFTKLNNGNFATLDKVNAIKYTDTIGKNGQAWATVGYYAQNPIQSTLLWQDDASLFGYTLANRGLYLNGKGSWGSLNVMIHVPATGKYKIDAVMAHPAHKAGTVNAYLMKLNSNRSVAVVSNAGASLDDIPNCVVKNGTVDATSVSFNSGEYVDLTAGEYILSILTVDAIAVILDSLTLAPEEKDVERYHIYDFRKINTGADVNGKLDYLTAGNMTYEKTATGGESEINESIYSDPWESLNLSLGGAWSYAYVLNGYQNMGIRVYYPNTTERSVKILVKGSGTYMPVLNIAGNTDGDLAWLNTTVRFYKLNSDGTQTLITERTGVDASAINGTIKVELADAPIQMKQNEEYVMALLGNQSMRSDDVGWSVWLQSIELINNYEAKLPVNQAGVEATKLYYDFTALNDEDHFDSQPAVNAITYADTVAAGSAPWKVYTSLPGRYSRGITEMWTEETKGFYYWQEGYGVMTADYGDDATNSPWRAGALMVHVPVDGKYVVKVNGGCYFGNNTNFYFAPLTSYRTPDTNGVKHTDAFENLPYKFTTNAVNANFAFNNGKAIELEAGEYMLYMFTSNGAYANSLTLIPEGYVEEVQNPDIFGAKGAYVTKSGEGYKVTFLSAIDSLDYEEVGFKVSVNGGVETLITTTNAYTSVAVENAQDAVTGASFDVADGYVFLESVDEIEGGATIFFTPYAKKADGTEILGKAFTANVPN